MREVFGPARSMPVTLVVATFRYRKIVRTWIEQARRTGCDHYRIVCMDEGLLEFLAGCGEASRAVSFWDVLPYPPREDIDAVEPPVERLRALTRLRVKLFLRLAQSGCDFIHSDADALWRRDPRPWLLRQTGFDLLFSQGTTHPRRHYRAHRFTLCAGFFLARGTERTRGYFAAADAMARCVPSDQERMNLLLLRDPSRRWHIARPRLAFARVPLGGSRVRCWSYASMGDAAHALATRLLLGRTTRVWALAALAAARLECMVTSPELMTGCFADGLRVGVIPMHMVPRIPLGDGTDVHVSHFASHKRGADGAPRWGNAPHCL